MLLQRREDWLAVVPLTVVDFRQFHDNMVGLFTASKGSNHIGEINLERDFWTNALKEVRFEDALLTTVKHPLDHCTYRITRGTSMKACSPLENSPVRLK